MRNKTDNLKKNLKPLKEFFSYYKRFWFFFFFSRSVMFLSEISYWLPWWEMMKNVDNGAFLPHNSWTESVNALYTLQKFSEIFRSPTISEYVSLIARYRVQHDQYFPSFTYFTIYFTRNMRNEGNICNTARGCNAITNLSQAQKLI